MSTSTPIRRIAISTGGGDAPGLNAVIRAATVAALSRGWEVLGVRDGYHGLLVPERYPKGGLMPLTREAVAGITHLGGTILGTTNRGDPFHFPVPGPDGKPVATDRSDDLVRRFAEHRIDALVSIGGDGSMTIAHALAKKGLRVVGVPKTIDNDLNGTEVTFGFETAVAFATECLDRLHTTAASHNRVLVVEVMGRYAGWIALHAGIAGSADVILLPEIPYSLDCVVEKLDERERRGKSSSIIVVAEGAKPKAGALSLRAAGEPGKAERLGGLAERLADEITARSGRETRSVVLGHLLRGGSPAAFDRLIALRFGAAAVRALAQGAHGVMVALDPPEVKHVPLEEATNRMKAVPPECDTMVTARELGICLGD